MVALDCFPERDAAARPIVLTPLGRGLINETHLVRGTPVPLVLQRVNPIFAPTIHHIIEAVTQRLAQAGMVTPVLRPTRQGRLWADLGQDGVWRLMTHVAGASFDVAQSAAQAHAAGALVARFHGALCDLDHEFVGARLGVHDTAAHLARLQRAETGCSDHRLHGAVASLAAEIRDAAAQLPPLPELALRPCHGDLKLNNLLFAGPASPASHDAICLIDLDTLGPMTLAHELGDAWRSWCNQAGEDVTEAQFDLGVFEASWQGYRRHGGDDLDRTERQGLLLGVEWICLELAARFAADALEESYFGWDAKRYPTRGDHNLVRAQGQLALHHAAARTRPARARLLGVPAG
ncbi:MAG: aminoglycoside phosphotransferase family protein [Deltaproteobacteria bacterium]|nr:aminoglycoside phosphotransferase family protein [Deltaproteobacteria bacterium]